MLMRWVKKKVLKDEDTDESLSHASGLPYIPGCLGLMMKSVLTVAVHWRCQDKWDWGVRFRWQRLSWWWHKWGKQSTGGCMQHGICFEFEACQVGCPRGKVSLTSIAFSIQYCWVSRSTWQKHGMWTQAWVTVDKLKILAKLWFQFFWGYCLVHLPQWDLGKLNHEFLSAVRSKVVYVANTGRKGALVGGWWAHSHVLFRPPVSQQPLLLCPLLMYAHVSPSWRVAVESSGSLTCLQCVQQRQSKIRLSLTSL